MFRLQRGLRNVKFRYVIAAVVLIISVTGCSAGGVFEKLNIGENTEVEVSETEPEIAPEEFLAESVRIYTDEIGKTEPGSRIVVKYSKTLAEEYSVYEFDDNGFTHSYYYFAYDDDRHIENQTGRITNFKYDEETALVDDEHNMVKFTSRYIQTGSNSYNYFRDVIMSQWMAQQTVNTGRRSEEFESSVEFDGYVGSVVGELTEYVPELPELETDEEGYVLCENGDTNWTYIADGSGGIVLTGYKSERLGSKLIIPSVIDGKEVYSVRQLDPLKGVTCVEIAEGVSELQGSFENWSDLNRVVLHDGLLAITNGTFSGTNVKSIELPESIVCLENGFFEGFHVGDVGDVSLSIDKLTGFYSGSDITSIIVPGKIKKICSFAFVNCMQLTTVFIEEGCLTVEDNAFYGAPNLQAVVIPRSVTFIGQSAFPDCTLLVVEEGSYAERYAEEYGYSYGYPQLQYNEAPE